MTFKILLILRLGKFQYFLTLSDGAHFANTPHPVPESSSLIQDFTYSPEK